MTKQQTNHQNPVTPPVAGVNLAEWRTLRAAGIERTLPSGLQVKLRRVKLQDLVMQGEIPQTLDALVKKATTSGFGIDDIQRFLPLVNAVFSACLIEPPIAESADETHVALSEFDLDDRIDVFMWANGAATAVAPFLAETARGVGTPPD